MTNEETENSINFIISQQAQTAVKLDRLTEKVDALAVAQNRAEERWTRTEDGIRALLTIAEMHEREIATLGDQTRATDDRLNTLINVVERQLSNGRNGK